MRNRFYEGEELEVLSAGAAFGTRLVVRGMRDGEGDPAADAKRVQEHYTFDCPVPLAAGDILRRRLPLQHSENTCQRVKNRV